MFELDQLYAVTQHSIFRYVILGLAAIGILSLFYVIIKIAHYTYIVMFKPISKLKKLKIIDDYDGNYIVMHQSDLKGTNFKSGDFIKLRMKNGLAYKKIEGELHRGKGNTINEGSIMLPETVIESLFGDIRVPEVAEFSIGQSTSLWNSPDTSVRIGTRVTVYVTIITTIISVLIEIWSAKAL
ncbi:hypothetical protein [Hyphococcus sp. DH-69]|uniref:hypothetical protein n=1 Tax=Hyphococcus formosus TaxID=3143534 RepID=UPI00398BBB51